MPSRRAVYLDACCFIEAVKHDVGIPITTERQQDVWHYKQLMQAHRDREIDVHTSVLSIAECSHADGDVSDSVKSIFRRLLLSGQYLTLVQPTPMIAESARDLRWVSRHEPEGCRCSPSRIGFGSFLRGVHNARYAHWSHQEQRKAPGLGGAPCRGANDNVSSG